MQQAPPSSPLSVKENIQAWGRCWQAGRGSLPCHSTCSQLLQGVCDNLTCGHEDGKGSERKGWRLLPALSIPRT